MPSFRLSSTAQEDIVEIVAYTEKRFGDAARRRYEVLLVTSLRDIASDPERAGSAARPELGLMVRSYHLRHCRARARTQAGLVRQPRHLLLYRAMRADLIGVGRVLQTASRSRRSYQANTATSDAAPCPAPSGLTRTNQLAGRTAG